MKILITGGCGFVGSNVALNLDPEHEVHCLDNLSKSESKFNEGLLQKRDIPVVKGCISEEGYFVFGIDRDRKFDVIITKIIDDKKERIIKKVLKRKYNIQRIDGLEESKVTPP